MVLDLGVVVGEGLWLVAVGVMTLPFGDGFVPPILSSLCFDAAAEEVAGASARGVGAVHKAASCEDAAAVVCVSPSVRLP